MLLSNDTDSINATSNRSLVVDKNHASVYERDYSLGTIKNSTQSIELGFVLMDNTTTTTHNDMKKNKAYLRRPNSSISTNYSTSQLLSENTSFNTSFPYPMAVHDSYNTSVELDSSKYLYSDSELPLNSTNIFTSIIPTNEIETQLTSSPSLSPNYIETKSLKDKDAIVSTAKPASFTPSFSPTSIENNIFESVLKPLSSFPSFSSSSIETNSSESVIQPTSSSQNKDEYASFEQKDPTIPQPQPKPMTNAIAAGVFCAVFGICFLCVFIYIIRKTLPDRRRKKYSTKVRDSNSSDLHFEDDAFFETQSRDSIEVKTPLSSDSCDKLPNLSNSSGNSCSQYNYSLDDLHNDFSDVSIGSADKYKSDYDENIIVAVDPSHSNENSILSFKSELEYAKSELEYAKSELESAKSGSQHIIIKSGSHRMSSKSKENIEGEEVSIQPAEEQKLHVLMPPPSDSIVFHGENLQEAPLIIPENIISNVETPIFSNSEKHSDIVVNNTHSSSAATSVNSLWNYKMASFISVAENTWDKPISASQTYTLSSDSTDEWLYEKAAEAIDPQLIDTKLPPAERTSSEMTPIGPPTYTSVAKITSYDIHDRQDENSSAIEMEIQPEKIVDLEKKVIEKMNRGNGSVFSDKSDRIRRSYFAPPGKLGVFIDTTKTGPVIHQVKEVSPMFDVLFTGDQIIAIDDVNVRSMTAAAVTKIMTKRAEFNRKITVLSANHPV